MDVVESSTTINVEGLKRMESNRGKRGETVHEANDSRPQL